MLRVRMDVPLHLYLNANDPGRLNPSLNFEHGTSKIQMHLRGGVPLHIDDPDYSEPDFRTVSLCQIEICDESESDDLLTLVAARDLKGVVDFVTPIVNRILLAIRNFGWVTTAREYKPEREPETLLRAWRARARIRGKWRELSKKPKHDALHGFLGLEELDKNVERGSLSVNRWLDIEQALVENLKPNPEQEFLTNALQHLREGNLRFALIEATVCLEIVLSQCLKAHLEVRHEFSNKKIGSVLGNVGLTCRVGLVLDLILNPAERQKAQIDAVLKAIGWRNKIIHDTGRLPETVPSQEVKDGAYAMLGLALMLGERRERLRLEPEVKQLCSALAAKAKCPVPTIEILKYHRVKATFIYFGAIPPYLRPLGMPVPPATPIPDENAMREIIEELNLNLRARDPWFHERQHLSVVFQHYPDRVFALFENGELKRVESQDPAPARPRSILG